MKSPSNCIRWDCEMRQTLCCLYRFYSCKPQELVSIFSAIFKRHLLECGLPRGIASYPTLNAQWYQMRRDCHNVWYHVHVDSEFRRDGEWKTRISLIESTAMRLRISLRRQLSDNIDTSNFKPKKLDIDYLQTVLTAVSLPKIVTPRDLS